jgi:hypothetical protein
LLLTAEAANQPAVTVRWEEVIQVSKTTPTLQVVALPPLRRGSKIHDRAFQALQELGCDYVRYAPWYPYPRLAVAALEPPRDGKTSWDFSLIDPMMEDFMNAVRGHSIILNFPTIPQWMFKTPQPVAYPADPEQVTWNYQQGTEFRDPTLKEVADYYGRVARWYTQGGFTDEYGRRHESGHHYRIDYWEVLNEIELEHALSPQLYTRLYDAVVEAVRKVDPRIKFVGLALAGTSPSGGLGSNPLAYFEYFLDPRNHKPGIPLDMISYHFYAIPTPDQTIEIEPYTFFDQADNFLNSVRYIEAIRRRLAPDTRTTVNETGSISAEDLEQMRNPGLAFKPLPASYWNLSGALYAYIYAQLARLGIDVCGESQLVGFPTQFPSVSMVDWETGQPNARYWVLKLLKDNFGPGDKLVGTSISSPYVFAQGFVTRGGGRKILLVNKRNRLWAVSLPASGASVECVDQTTGFAPPAAWKLTGDQLPLSGFAVAVVTLPQK